MRVLLDTHAFLWYMSGDPALGEEARRVIDDRTNERLLSAAALWEMATKVSQGRLDLGAPNKELIPALLEVNAIGVLAPSMEHMGALAELAFPASGHKDPFDRVMVAQCLVEGIPLVTRDERVRGYPIEWIW